MRLLRLSFLSAALVALGLVPATAGATISRQDAKAKALSALHVTKGKGADTVFTLPQPIPAGTVITAAGRYGGPTAAASSARPGTQRLQRAGVTTAVAPRVATVGDAPAWFFYEDRAPYESYAHPGRVALVDTTTGKVTLTRTLQWPPLIAGHLPAFLRTAAAYRDARYRVYDRPWKTAAPAPTSTTPLPAANTRSPLDAAAARRQTADALAADHACAVRVSDTLGDFYDATSVDQSRARLGVLLNALARLNPGFISARYQFATVRGGASLTSYITHLVTVRKCQDLMLYVAGGGYVAGGQATINLGTRVRPDGRIEQQTVTASELRSILHAHPGVTFKLMLDAPYSGGFGTALRNEPNLITFLSSASPAQGSFSALTAVVDPQGRPVANTYNKSELLEFSNRELTGLRCFMEDPAEVAAAVRARANGTSKSFMAWMLARGFSLCSTGSLAGAVQGAPQPVLTLNGFTAGPPAPVTTTPPAAPSAPAAPAAPAPPAGPSGPQDLLAPTVTTTAGTTTYTEDDPATVVDPGLTVTDTDSATLTRATAQLAPGDAPGEDVLELTAPAPDGITTTFDAATGTLTLAGSAPVAAYQAALRTVAYRNTSEAPSTAPRSVRFVATDAVGTASTPAVRDLAVTATNDGPTAADDAYTTDEDTPLTIAAPAGVLANDADADGDALTVDQVDDDPANVGTAFTTINSARLTINADGSLTYDPDGQFDGLAVGQHVTDTITYRIGDGTDHATAAITFTVAGADDAPTANPDGYITDQDTPLTITDPGLLGNDGDIDGDPLTVDQVDGDPADVGTEITTTGGAHATVNADGSLSYDPDGQFDDLATGQHATDTITYRAADGHGGTDTATITITITGINDAPVATDDASTTGKASVLTIAAPGVLGNDTDADTGDALTVNDVDGSTPAVGTDTTLASGAHITVNADGSLSYDPSGQFTGLAPGDSATDTFTYRTADDHGALSATATVTVTITGSNSAPHAMDDTYSTDSGTVLTISAPGLLADDSDADADPLNVDQFGPGTTVGTQVSTPRNALLTVNADGSFTYDDTGADPVTPGATDTDTFTYRVNDGHGHTATATVTITIDGVDHAPVATDDAYTTDEDAFLTVAGSGVLTNDSDADSGDALHVDQVDGSAPAVGTAVATSGGGQITVNADGSLSYDPDGAFESLGTGQHTTDTVTYRTTDSHGESDTATITFTITGADDAPVAIDDGYSANEDATLTVPASGVLTDDSDVDTGDTLSVAQVNGSAATVDTTTPLASGALLTLHADGSFSYNPNGQFEDLAAGQQTTDTFTYRAADDQGALSATATVTVTIHGANDAPVAQDDALATDEDTPLIIAAPGVLANDNDVDAGDALTVGQVDGSSANVGTQVTTTAGAHVTVNSNGSLSYDPNGQFDSLAAGQHATDTITYRATDGTDSDTATITFTIDGVDNAPRATDDAYTAVGNTELAVGATIPAGRAGKTRSGSVLDNDADADSTLSVTAGSRATTLGGTADVAADGTFTYTPPVGTTASTDSFDYTVNGGADSDTATVFITLAGTVWYVDNTATAGGDGSSAAPFDTLAEATAASATGDTIFVAPSSGTTGQNAGAVLKANQRLIGAADDLVVGGATLYDGDPVQRPSIGNAAGAGVTLASGSTVEGFNISSAGGPAIKGTSTVAGSTIADVAITGSGGGLELSGTTGTIALSDTSIDTSGGTALSAIGVGALAFADAGTISVETSGARAIDISGGHLSGTIDSVTDVAAPGGAVLVQGTTGSITFGDLSLAVTGGVAFLANNVAGLHVPADATVSLSSFNGGAVELDNNVAPDVTLDTVFGLRATGNVVEMSGNSGGGTVTFSGPTSASSSTANIAVNLTNNTGTAIAFTGGLTIDSGAADGLSATGGGTLTVTGPGNTITSVGGTPLHIADTTIGAANATFESISADGGPNGIVLDTTGSAGHLAVTGTGAAGSGGTIQDIGGASGGTHGIGISLDTTSAPSLTSMHLTANSNWAILGNAVSDLAIDDTVIDGSNGDDDFEPEGAVRLTQLTGTSSITGTAISGGYTDNLHIANTSGTADITLDGDTIGGNDGSHGDDGVDIEATGTATETTTVNDTHFTGARTNLFHSVTDGTATNDATFTGNTLTNGQASQQPGAGGALIATAGSGTGATLTYRVSDNTVSGTDGDAIAVLKGPGIATVRGRVEDNDIGLTGVTGSGSAGGSGIIVHAGGQGTYVARVAGNTVRQYDQYAIRNTNGEKGPSDDGTLDVQLSAIGNTAAEPVAADAVSGLESDALDPTATVDACVDLQGNVLSDSRGAGADLAVTDGLPQDTVRLPGYAGAALDGFAVQNYLAGRNTLVLVLATAPASGPGFVNGGTGCTQPPA